MEQHYKNFVTILFKFISDYNRYCPSDGATKILNLYNNLDMAKVIFRTYHLLKENSEAIKNKNETLFDRAFIILPDIDISLNWNKLTSGQKNKLFTYLHILVLESEILMNFKENKDEILPVKKQEDNLVKKQEDSLVKKQEDSLVKKQEDSLVKNEEDEKQLLFNPYVGIGEQVESYSVNEMFSSIPTLEEDKPAGPGIETIANMIGINKMINIEELTNQLKNMKKEDIDNATNSIKTLLGNNIDEKTTSLISDMLSNISDELKNNDMTKGDPFKNIFNIAEVVAGKMKPQIEKENIDVSQLINSTQNFATQCKDKDGNPMFTDEMNPFNLLSKLVGNMNKGNFTEDQYMNQCNDVLKNLGVNNLNINEISNQFNKTLKKKGKGGKRKKK